MPEFILLLFRCSLFCWLAWLLPLCVSVHQRRERASYPTIHDTVPCRHVPSAISTQDQTSLAIHALCTTFAECLRCAASTSVADSSPPPELADPLIPPGLGGSTRARGAPEIKVKRLEAVLGPVMDQFRHLRFTLARKETIGIRHPLEDGFIGACAACHLAGQPVVDENGQPVTDANGDVKTHGLHSVQADGCMASVRFAKAATSQDAADTAPSFVDRVLPVEGAEGVAFRPTDGRLPGRGIREIADKIDKHMSVERAPSEQPAASAAAAPAAALGGAPPPPPCNEFEAADAPLPKAKDRGLFDILGFFGLLCRHRVLLLGCHMYSGERRSYLIALLWVLLTVHACTIGNILYDIGPCQFHPTLDAFLRLPPSDDIGLTESVIALLKCCLLGSNFPLLPFHFYCHRALCQALFDAFQMKGTALQHGEGTEMKWSLFGRLVGRMKGMGKAARYAAIEYWWFTENRRQDVRRPDTVIMQHCPLARVCPCFAARRMRVRWAVRH